MCTSWCFKLHLKLKVDFTAYINYGLIKQTFNFVLKDCRLLQAEWCHQKVATVGSVQVNLERMEQNLEKENVFGKQDGRLDTYK